MRKLLLLCLVTSLLVQESYGEHSYAHQKDKGGGPRDLPADRGAYVAPPRSGVEVGESTALGIKGLGLHFPALSLRLPTLTLPSLVKHRSRAHMLVEPDVAPYVDEVAREEYGVDAGARDLAPPPTPRNIDTPDQKGVYQKISDRSDEDGGYRHHLAHQSIEGKGENNDAAWVREQAYERKIEALNLQLEECSKMSELLQKTLRNQAAMGRLPSATISHTPDHQRRLPAINIATNTREIQQASHWTTANLSEPRLLERLPRDTMSRVPHPSSSQYR